MWGKVVYEYHQKMHLEMKKKLMQKINSFSEESLVEITELIQMYSESLDEM